MVNIANNQLFLNKNNVNSMTEVQLLVLWYKLSFGSLKKVERKEKENKTLDWSSELIFK